MTLHEAETRRQLIDEKLRLAGWNVQDPSQVIQELDIDLTQTGHSLAADPKPISPYSGHQFADYALLIHGKPAAVIEAKKTPKDAALGKEQALQYAQNIQKIHGGRLPLIFYTNGYDTYCWESDFYPPEKVFGFPTKDDLEWINQRQATRRPLSVELINTETAGRDYQIAAIRTILEGMEAKRRKFLLVMATGTGKTRTAVALLDVLSRARWAKRVLFLVDRIALRDQALDAFKEFMPSEPRWPNQGEGQIFPKDRRVYVTTYQTMLNIIQSGNTPESWLSPYFFDVVLADESHRSIYNIYTHVLDYFHAIKLGLTATPTNHIDHDTFQLFECDTHHPTFAYSYQEAVEHEPPYLCDFEVLKVRSKFQFEGIKGGALPPAIQKKLIAEGTDIEDIDFEGTDLERKVTNAGTNAVIIREFMEESIKDQSGTLPGKSIIFAITKAHARRLEELFDKLYPEHRGNLARVLVSDDPRVYGKGGLLDQFKNQDMPRIAISVDMLDTGVDVREVVNLVFAKPVYSYVKFWQMIGRGTRVLHDEPEKRQPWCVEKDSFLIVDCWGNFDFFAMQPKGREPGQQISLPVKLFTAKLDKLEAAVSVAQHDIARTVKQTLREDLSALPEHNVIVADKQRELAVVKPDTFWDRLKTEDLGYLRTVIAPILRARTHEDFKAMRFEMEVVELGTAWLSDNKTAMDGLRESLMAQISELPLTVNIVAREHTLIEEVLQTHWWASLSDEKCQQLSDRLAPLMKYRQPRTDPMVHLDIADLVAVKEWIEFGPEHERMTSSAYREKVEAYVRDLVANNLVLQKIKNGEEVSDTEIQDLINLLQQQDLPVTEETLRKVYDHKTAHFLQFMRHILGLEKLESWSETVTKAFDAFIAEHNTFTALQVQFLQTLRTFMLQTGKAEKEHLIAPPFTNLHPQGIRGLFAKHEIQEILTFVEEIGQQAA